MRKVIIVILVLLIALVVAVPVFADNLGPCNDGGAAGPGPGNSDYAKHHIVPADLGNDAHKPGSHGGYSLCLGTGRLFNQP